MSAEFGLVRRKCPTIGMTFCLRFVCFHTHSGFDRRKEIFFEGAAKGKGELLIVE
jgi:hypothetical protein